MSELLEATPVAQDSRTRGRIVTLGIGQLVSETGSQISVLLIPTIAIKSLGAGPFVVGLLGVAAFAPVPLFGLHAGAVADNRSRTAVMIVSDLARAAVTASIPLALVLHAASVVHLMAISLVVGGFTVLFDVACQSWVPNIVGSEAAIARANSLLAMGRNAAMFAGPAVGGLLLSWIGAAGALGADSASYLVSAAAVVVAARARRRRRADPSDGSDPQGGAARKESRGTGAPKARARDGLLLVWRHPVLRSVAIVGAVSNLGIQMAQANYLVYVYKNLHLSPETVGLVFSTGAIAGVASSFIAPRIIHILGRGGAMSVAALIAGASWLALPIASAGNPLLPLAACLVIGFAMPLYDIAQLTLRQSLSAPETLGRINSGVRTLAWTTIPVGFLIGGALGSLIGPGATLCLGAVVAVSASGICAARLWSVQSSQDLPRATSELA